MKINIQFYGRLREQFNTANMQFESNETSLADLYDVLCKKNQLSNNKQGIRPILNDEFSSWDATFNENDTVGYLPPASGG